MRPNDRGRPHAGTGLQSPGFAAARRSTYRHVTCRCDSDPVGPVERPLSDSWQDDIFYMGWPSSHEHARLAWWLVHTSSVPERRAITDMYADRFLRDELYFALDCLASFVRLPDDLEEIRRERLMLGGDG